MLIIALVTGWIILGVWIVLAVNKIQKMNQPKNDNPRMKIVR